VLQGEDEFIALTHEVGVGVAPCVQIGAAAQGLAEPAAAALGHVVDDDDGEVRGA